MQEIERYQMNPPNSINRHRIRVFQTEDGRKIMLDRTMDTYPPCFNATEMPQPGPGMRFGRTIPVDGREYWGDGLRWSAAIRKLEETLTLSL